MAKSRVFLSLLPLESREIHRLFQRQIFFLNRLVFFFLLAFLDKWVVQDTSLSNNTRVLCLQHCDNDEVIKNQ